MLPLSLSRNYILALGLLMGTASGAHAANLKNLICSGGNDDAPVYVLVTKGGAYFRIEATFDSKGRYKGQHVPVQKKEIDAECASGVSIAALQIETPGPAKSLAKGETVKTVVPPQASLPTSFTIRTSTSIACKYGLEPPCARTVWGNFWVPGTMPATQQAHIVHYTLSQWQFNASTPGTHFVNSVLTVSNTNFDTDFQGKGLIIGVANDCGGNYSAILQTWQNNQQMESETSAAWYATCNTISPTGVYDIYVGANRQQGLQAIINGPGLSNANPTVSVFERYFWSSPWWAAGLNPAYPNQYPYVSYDGLGASGVAFLVVGPSRVPAAEEWALTFDNVFQYTTQ